jgi:hypothetical protein
VTGAEGLPRVTVKGILLAVVISLVVGIGLSEVLLRIVTPNWKEFSSARFMTRVAVPGHKSVVAGLPSFDGYFAQNNGDFRVRFRLNAFGHRNPEPVAAANGQIWVIGDSMAFGWGVERDEMYSEILEKRLGGPVYNLASPGTDICGYQAMVARMPKTIKPRSVVVGLILENDLRIYDCPIEAAAEARAKTTTTDRQPRDPDDSDSSGSGFSLLEIKQFATRNFALYNFFAVSLKRVAAVQDFLVGLNIISKPHAVNRRVAPDQVKALAISAGDELVRLKAMLPDGTPFHVLIAPTRFEIRDDTALYRNLRLAVTQTLRDRGIFPIDPFPAFKAAGFAPSHFQHDGHWSALGHRIAAEAITGRLKLPNPGERRPNP